MTKYDSVKRFLQDRITNGELRPGDRIPTEEELVQLLGVSRNPVRRALSDLVQDGWIFTLRGSGSYVRQLRRTDTVTVYALLYAENRRFESELIRGMRIALDNHPDTNLELVLKKPGRDTRQMIEVLRTIDASRPGGVVFLPVLDGDRSTNRMLGAALRSLEAKDFAVIQLDRFIPEYDGSYVMSDHKQGAKLLTEHLISQGHHGLGVLYEHPENTSIDLRLEGVRETLEANGIQLARNHLLHIPYEEVRTKGEKIVTNLLSEGVTCLFCFENAIAREIVSLAEDIGLKIPDDLSLCSFDDHSFNGEYRDMLTCVIQPLEDIGFFSVDIILKNLETTIHAPVRMMLEPELVIRRSVARR